MTRTAPAFFVAISLFGEGSQDLVISQIYGGGGNAGAPFRNDFIELFNRGNAPVSVAGWSVQYTSAAGDEWQVTGISGVVAPGRYYLVQQAVGANTAAAALPDPDATGTIAMGAASAKVALVRSTVALAGATPSGTAVVDLVGYGTANGSETAPTPALSNTTAAIRRGGGCTDTDNNAADFQAAIPRPRNSAEAQVDCSIGAPAPISRKISEIQGAGDESPVAGFIVVTRGIVTGRKTNGFFIQSAAEDVDSDPATSEGLFIFTQSAPPVIAAVNALVEVTGTVTEFRPASDPDGPTLTELVDPSVTLIAENQRIPAAALLSRFANWEWLEGMRVGTEALRVVGPSGGSVNEANAMATTNGVFYTVEQGGLPPFASAAGAIGSRMLRIDSRALGRQPLDVRVADVVDRVTGPLDFGFRTYTIDPDATFLVLSNLTPSRLLPRAEGQYAVASMNLQRLFDDRDDPGKSDPVVTPAAVQTRLARIARVIRDVLGSPEVIGVSEVENLGILQSLAQAVGGYEAFLVEGNDIGGIDVGALVRTDRVTVDSFAQEGKSTPLDDALLNDRPPIVLRARISGVPVVLVVNHSRSLIDAETPTVARKRRLQAEFLTTILRREVVENLVSVGDYNMPAHDQLMTLLKSPGLANLSDTIRPDEAYTYIQDGVKQALDHVLLSPTAYNRLSRYQIAHINADFPETSRNAETGTQRISDHDIPIAYFDSNPVSFRPVNVTNAASFTTGSIAAGEWLMLHVPGPLQSVRFGGTAGTIITSTASQTTVVAPVRGFSPEISVGTTGPLLLPVANAAPGIFTLTGTGRGQGAILNQDLSINGVDNPAARGSVLSIYATGLSTAPPAVWIGSTRAEILYAGAAPTLPEGTFQINARVPAAAVTGNEVSVFVSAGDQVSGVGVTAAIR